MRLNDLLQCGSLKTRVTLFTLAIFLLGIWSLAFYISRMLREDMQGLLADQQLSVVSILAAEIDHELNDRLGALETVAAAIDPAILRDTATLQALLENRPLLQSLFSGGFIACGPDGTAIADVPRSAGRIGVNYMGANTVATAIKQGKSTIGRPVMGKKLHAPVFGMTTPIRDTQGKAIGALSGVVNLGKANFLDRIIENPYGKTGGYVLFIPKDRLIVTATDKSRVMQPLPAPGSNRASDRFIQGYEGSAVHTNSHGVEVLVSAKGIPAAGWVIAATLPTAEAFAPIGAMQQRMLLAAVILTLLAGGATWWMLRRQLSPMLDAVKTLATLSDKGQSLLPLPITRRDEIGQLIGAFNRLLEILRQREVVLRDSEELYRSFFQASPDSILVHRKDIIIFANEASARLFHADSVSALIGRDWHELIAPEDWAITEKRIADIASGATSHLPPLERRHVALDGQVVSVESAGAHIIFGGQPAVLTVIRDITARKQTETQRLADARQQRDTLVREVHHRIKNNLQSVAGLLQRELGKFLELDPRLEAAISQVHAIAVVHGLQSTDPDEAVRLCDSVGNICKIVSELSSRPVSFCIENEQTAFRPVQIASGDAVSVALVLNELILNAVKHSPPDGIAPTVSLAADGRSAEVFIRNAVKNRHTTDVDIAIDVNAGRGLGTGLRLVRSLLPDQGAELTHELDAAGLMLTILKLTPPVIGNVRSNESG